MGSKRFEDWNSCLKSHVKDLSQLPGVTVLYYSSFVVFSQILAEPEVYGFSKNDVRKAGGSIWMDILHPTGAVHEILADDMLKFLNGLNPQ